MRKVSFFYPFIQVYLRYHELERDDEDDETNEWNPVADRCFSGM